MRWACNEQLSLMRCTHAMFPCAFTCVCILWTATTNCRRPSTRCLTTRRACRGRLRASSTQSTTRWDPKSQSTTVGGIACSWVQLPSLRVYLGRRSLIVYVRFLGCMFACCVFLCASRGGVTVTVFKPGAALLNKRLTWQQSITHITLNTCYDK